MKLHLTAKTSVEVATYEEASRAVRERWAKRPSSAFYRDPRAGLLVEADAVVAHVSYNGRVWAGANRFALRGGKLLFDTTTTETAR